MKSKKSIQAAAESLGLPKLREFQIGPISSILDHQDTLVLVSTPETKPAVYQIPAVIIGEEGKWTLVIEPTHALIADQVNRLQHLGIAAEMMTKRNLDEHDEILDKLRKNELAILYITPGKLNTSAFRSVVQKNPPWLLVIDEAHCALDLDWVPEFRPAYLRIKSFIKILHQRPVVAAFTSEAYPDWQSPICELFGMKKVQTYILSLARDNVILLKEDCSDLNMKKRLSRVKYNIDKYGKGGRTVVYCETSDNVDVVSNYLSEKFPGEVVKCHINMGLDKLEKHASRFLSGSKRIVVCARGLETMVDVPDMRLVIYFNLPVNIPEYYWTISRAGQDGKKSHAILLYHPDDTDLLLNGLDKANISRDAVRWICDSLNEMVSLAESDRCLMQQVLKSMGEDHPTKCRHCTNCQKDHRKS